MSLLLFKFSKYYTLKIFKPESRIRYRKAAVNDVIIKKKKMKNVIKKNEG